MREAGLKEANSLDAHSAAINSISFSENGYTVATGSQDNSVRIWDLRKLASVQTLDGNYCFFSFVHLFQALE